MNRFEKTAVVLAWVLFLVAAVVGTMNNGYNFYFNADEMYFPALYHDLFILGNPFFEWHLQPAPSYFPSMVLYFGLRALTGDFMWTTFLVAVLQNLTIAIAMYFVFVYAFPKAKLASHLLAALLGGVLVLIVGEDIQYMPAFANGTHYATIGAAWVAVIISLSYFKNASYSKLVWLGLLTSVTVTSDPLYLASYSVPFLGVITVLALFRYISLPNSLQFFGTVGVSTLVGYWGFQHSPFTRTIPFGGISMDKIINGLKKIPPTFDYYLQAEHMLYTVLFCVGFLAIVAFSVRFLRRNYNKMIIGPVREFDRSAQLATFCLYFFGATLALFTSSLGAGSYGSDMATFGRHFITIIQAPIFAIGLLGLWFLRRPLSTPAGIVAVLVLLGGSVIASQRFPYDHQKTFFSYIPPHAACVDRLDERYDLQYGLADYWIAKPVMMYSERGVFPVQTLGNVKPFMHINSRHWYKQEKAHFNFIIADNVHVDEITGYLGKPTVVEHCQEAGAGKVLFYSKETDFNERVHAHFKRKFPRGEQPISSALESAQDRLF